MDYFRRMGVYRKIKRSEVPAGAKIITTKWVDTNKGTEQEPNYRSRLVGREIKTDDRPDLFAATPSTESLRYVLSLCASTQDGPNPHRILSVDVKRAYFYPPVKRPLFIELPVEDWLPGDEGSVAQLNLSLYGTRDAAQNWAQEYTRTLRAAGFTVGKASPCIFYHKSTGMALTVHGDDFTISGPERALTWLEEYLKTAWDVKATTLGPGSHQAREIRVLNRSIRWTARGLEYEADARHRQVILKELDLEGCRPVTTPYGPQEQGCLQDEGELLSGPEATKYRAICERLNYLAADRPDIQYAANECSKRMALPRKPDWLLLKRVGRYFAGAPRGVQLIEWQPSSVGLSTYVDSDWAGDKKTCKSTSGGMIFRGGHLLKSWSTNQQIIALSSGEAELYAQIKGAAQTLGMVSMGNDFGELLTGTVFSDSSAALGIVTRSGLGKVRHIRVQYLWLQERVAGAELRVRKVAGEVNPADLLTKGLAQELLKRHSAFCGFEFREEEEAKRAMASGAGAPLAGIYKAQENPNPQEPQNPHKPNKNNSEATREGTKKVVRFVGGIAIKRGMQRKETGREGEGKVKKKRQGNQEYTGQEGGRERLPSQDKNNQLVVAGGPQLCRRPSFEERDVEKGCSSSTLAVGRCTAREEKASLARRPATTGSWTCSRRRGPSGRCRGVRQRSPPRPGPLHRLGDPCPWGAARRMRRRSTARAGQISTTAGYVKQWRRAATFSVAGRRHRSPEF